MDLRDGPPVFTPPRNVEKEIAAWRRRNVKKYDAVTEAEPGDQPADQASAGSPRRWWHRFRR